MGCFVPRPPHPLERCEGLLRLPAGAVVPLPPLALPLRAAGSAQCWAADVATQRGELWEVVLFDPRKLVELDGFGTAPADFIVALRS